MPLLAHCKVPSVLVHSTTSQDTAPMLVGNWKFRRSEKTPCTMTYSKYCKMVHLEKQKQEYKILLTKCFVFSPIARVLRSSDQMVVPAKNPLNFETSREVHATPLPRSALLCRKVLNLYPIFLRHLVYTYMYMYTVASSKSCWELAPIHRTPAGSFIMNSPGKQQLGTLSNNITLPKSITPLVLFLYLDTMRCLTEKQQRGCCMACVLRGTPKAAGSRRWCKRLLFSPWRGSVMISYT